MVVVGTCLDRSVYVVNSDMNKISPRGRSDEKAIESCCC